MRRLNLELEIKVLGPPERFPSDHAFPVLNSKESIKRKWEKHTGIIRLKPVLMIFSPTTSGGIILSLVNTLFLVTKNINFIVLSENSSWIFFAWFRCFFSKKLFPKVTSALLKNTFSQSKIIKKKRLINKLMRLRSAI